MRRLKLAIGKRKGEDHDGTVDGRENRTFRL